MALTRHAPCLAHKQNPGSFSATGVQFLERETGFEDCVLNQAYSINLNKFK
jgi:hypothetical protein